MNNDKKFGRIDKEGNNYFMLTINEFGNWEQIPISFLLNEGKTNEIIGQFVSSMWYNVKIPTKDFEIIIVRVKSELVTKQMPDLLSLLNKCEFQERKHNKNVMINYVLKKSIIDEIRGRLMNRENGGSEHFNDTVGNNEIGFSFILKKINNEIIDSMYSPCFILNNN
mgnify:CR=1 FL=1|jgi:hypothetical protein